MLVGTAASPAESFPSLASAVPGSNKVKPGLRIACVSLLLAGSAAAPAPPESQRHLPSPGTRVSIVPGLFRALVPCQSPCWHFAKMQACQTAGGPQLTGYALAMPHQPLPNSISLNGLQLSKLGGNKKNCYSLCLVGLQPDRWTMGPPDWAPLPPGGPKLGDRLPPPLPPVQVRLWGPGVKVGRELTSELLVRLAWPTVLRVPWCPGTS